MAFKHPEILFFLFLIIIPIIIHLFSFRKYKKVYFHNLQIIKNIQIEQNSTKSKLKELLILLSRICFITFLVLTFAQPYIPHKQTEQQSPNRHVAIYIDNSFSTQSESSEGIILDVEKKRAQQIIDASPSETAFFLLTNDEKPSDFYPRTQEDIRDEITRISPSPHSVKISDIYKKIQTCGTKNNCPIQWHILSDLQQNTSNFNEIANDSAISITLHPIAALSTNNISIDSCFFESNYHIPGKLEKLTVSLSNNSDETVANLPVKLFIDDSLRAISNATIKAHSQTKVSVEYETKKTGFINGRLEIEDYPILYDNTYYFSYTSESEIAILDIYEKDYNSHIEALCKNQDKFSITRQQISKLDYSQIQDYQVLILDGLQAVPTGLINEVEKMSQIGKTIVCIPSENIDIESYNNFLAYFGRQRFSAKDTSKTNIQSFEINDGLLKSVFEKNDNNTTYPTIFIHYKTENQQNNALITLQDNQPFLWQAAKGQNTLFAFSSPLTTKSGTFVSSPLFMCLYNILLYNSSSDEIQTTLGNSSEIFIKKINDDHALHIENKEKNIDVIPQYRTNPLTAKTIIHPMQQINTAGNFKITQDDKQIRGISYNYDRRESELSYFTADEISDKLQGKCNIVNQTDDIAETIKEIQLGTDLWRYFLLASIFFILLEICVIMFYDKIFSSKIETKNTSENLWK